jgi:hypothetical protein
MSPRHAQIHLATPGRRLCPYPRRHLRARHRRYLRAHGHSMSELQALRAEASRPARQIPPPAEPDPDDRLF